METKMKITHQGNSFKNLNRKQGNKQSSGTSFGRDISNDFSDQINYLRLEKLKQELFECEKRLTFYLQLEKENNPEIDIDIPTPFYNKDNLTRWDGYVYEQRQLAAKLKKCKAMLAKLKSKYKNIPSHRTRPNRPLYASSLMSEVNNQPKQNIPDSKFSSIYDCTLSQCFYPFRCNCFYLNQNK